MSVQPRIMVAGEALVDLMVGHNPRQPDACPGGSPANTAIALARLGTPVTFAGRFGDDHFGDLLLANLAGNDVDLRYCVEAGQPTSLAVVSLDADGSACYRFHVDGTADWAWQATELPAELPDDILAVHTGSLAVALAPGADVLTAWFVRQRKWRTTSFDPNIRPALVGAREDYLPKLEALVAASDIVKVSKEDLAWAYPGHDPLAVAQRWERELAVRLVIVTFGAEGAVAVHKSGTVHRVAAVGSVVDTVGAGDTFSAAILHWLAGHDRLAKPRIDGLTAPELAAALDYASAAAGVACTRPGADPPHAHELEPSR